MDLAIPVLHTQRLTLRACTEDDFDAVADFFADDVSSLYGGPCDRITAWRKFAAWLGHWVLRGYGPWGLELKSTGEFVGWSGLWNPEGWPEPEITWALLPQFHGQGFATEGARRALQSAYEDFGWETAISLIDDRNTASVAVARRLGATAERADDVFGNPGSTYRHVGLDVLDAD